jgi:hypothetical protein
MLYIKIGDEKYPAEFESFTTQLGHTAIRVISDAPTAEGFLIVDENDKVISDKSDYTFLYMEEENAKDYTNVAEEPIPTQSFSVGSPINPIQRQINALNKRVSDITPYEQSKVGYYGESEKVFYGVPQGNVSVFFDNYDGGYEISRVEDRLTVSLPERLQDMTNINIMIQ